MLHMVEAIVIGTQIAAQNRLRQGIHVRLRQIHAVRNIRIHHTEHHICRISGPAAQICSGLLNTFCHTLRGRIAGNIHRAEHMSQIHGVAIRQLHFLQIFQSRCPSAVLRILLCHIGGKGGIFRPGQCGPCAGGIAFYTGTDKIDHQRTGVLLRILRSIICRIGLQFL